MLGHDVNAEFWEPEDRAEDRIGSREQRRKRDEER
jgi:hypothetical protein